MPYYPNMMRGRYPAGGYYMQPRQYASYPRPATVNETELASTTLQVQLKRIYVDVKQNERGRFVKISHGVPGEQKNRVAFPFEAAYQLRRVLQNLAEYEQTLAAQKADTSKQATTASATPYLRTETIVFGDRKYFLDFRENQHGRFLRIHQQTIAGAPFSASHGPAIIIPSPGIGELAKLVDEYLTTYFAKELTNYTPPASNEQTTSPVKTTAGASSAVSNKPSGSDDSLPGPSSIKSGNKTFYFDVGRNARGVFLRITEASPRVRTSITVPLESWSQMNTVLGEYVTKCASQLAELESANAKADEAASKADDADADGHETETGGDDKAKTKPKDGAKDGTTASPSEGSGLSEDGENFVRLDATGEDAN